MRLLALALALLATPASAQPRRPFDPAEPARRAADGQARLAASPAGRVVLRAIEAHGGLEAWFGGRALAFDYAYRPTGDKPARVSYQVVDLLASRAYHELAEPVAGRFAWDGQRAWSTFDPKAAAPRFWALTPYYFLALPFVLGDPGVRLAVVDDDPAAAGLPPADVIKVTYETGTGDAPDDYYVCYFSKEDGHLLATRYVVSYKAFHQGTGKVHGPEKLVVYGDLQRVGPVKLALRHETYAFEGGRRGELVTISTVTRAQHGVTFDETRLDMPAGAHLDTSLDGL
ncbi:MAG: hypothetical protein R3F60_24355 [bacterium]